MPRYTHPDDDKVYACPECDSSEIRKRDHRFGVSVAPGKTFACGDCKFGFEEPVERDDKKGQGDIWEETMPDHIVDIVKKSQAE